MCKIEKKNLLWRWIFNDWLEKFIFWRWLLLLLRSNNSSRKRGVDFRRRRRRRFRLHVGTFVDKIVDKCLPQCFLYLFDAFGKGPASVQLANTIVAHTLRHKFIVGGQFQLTATAQFLFDRLAGIGQWYQDAESF